MSKVYETSALPLSYIAMNLVSKDGFDTTTEGPLKGPVSILDYSLVKWCERNDLNIRPLVNPGALSLSYSRILVGLLRIELRLNGYRPRCLPLTVQTIIFVSAFSH